MRTIYKYQIQTTDLQEIRIPGLYKILTVQTQRDVPCLWVKVDTDVPNEPVMIEVFGTGHEMPESPRGRQYIGSYQLHGGTLVFHVFERL